MVQHSSDLTTKISGNCLITSSWSLSSGWRQGKRDWTFEVAANQMPSLTHQGLMNNSPSSTSEWTRGSAGRQRAVDKGPGATISKGSVPKRRDLEETTSNFSFSGPIINSPTTECAQHRHDPSFKVLTDRPTSLDQSPGMHREAARKRQLTRQSAFDLISSPSGVRSSTRATKLSAFESELGAFGNINSSLAGKKSQSRKQILAEQSLAPLNIATSFNDSAHKPSFSRQFSLEAVPHISFQGSPGMSHQNSIESKHGSGKTTKKWSSSAKPQFFRSATLEWTHEGPSSQIPSSEWIDSFTKQHGLENSLQRRRSFANAPKTSLEIPQSTARHRRLFKSPSAPTQQSCSKPYEGRGSTNSSFEHDPSDPVSMNIETQVMVHHPSSPDWEKKHWVMPNWSRKLGISGSQFLNAGWRTSNKRSPTYPLISPSQSSASSNNQEPIEKPLTSLEMSVDLDVDFADSELVRGSRSRSYETSWTTTELSSSGSNPVRRRIPMIKLHHSPNRSNCMAAADNAKVPDAGSISSGWLSVARKQHAKIKKCRAFGKLYTTVRVEDDDVSVLVTTD